MIFLYNFSEVTSTFPLKRSTLPKLFIKSWSFEYILIKTYPQHLLDSFTYIFHLPQNIRKVNFSNKFWPKLTQAFSQFFHTFSLQILLRYSSISRTFSSKCSINLFSRIIFCPKLSQMFPDLFIQMFLFPQYGRNVSSLNKFRSKLTTNIF